MEPKSLSHSISFSDVKIPLIRRQTYEIKALCFASDSTYDNLIIVYYSSSVISKFIEFKPKQFRLPFLLSKWREA